MSQSNMALVPFHGDQILTIKDQGGTIRVAVKPIAETTGLDWSSQFQRIKRDPVLSTCMVIITMQMPGDDQKRDIATLPLEMMHGWLFGIDASRVREEIRETILAYQRECYRVLSDYWRHGEAHNPRARPAEQAAARRELPRLLRELRAESQPEIRETLYALVKWACETVGAPVPPITAIGRNAPSLSERLTELRASLAVLDVLGAPYNHSPRSDCVAFNFNEIKRLFSEHDVPLKMDAEMKQALSDGLKTGVVANRSVRSCIDPKRVLRAWIIPAAPAACH